MSTALLPDGQYRLAELDPTFRFEEAEHRYTLQGRRLWSITQILQACGVVNSRYYTEAARHRGVYVHWVIRLLNEGQLDRKDIAPQYKGYIDGYERLAKEWNVRVQLFEVPLYHPILLFAGTPDIVCTIFDNIPAIIELKTGPLMKWVPLQTAGQDLLDRAWAKMPTRRRRFGVTLNVDGTYSDPKEYLSNAQDETVFRMFNTITRTFGDKTPSIFETIDGLGEEQRLELQVTSPLLYSAAGFRERYAA